MPRKPSVDFAVLGRQLRRLLDSGPPTSAPEITTSLAMSRATISRLLARHADDLLSIGRGRARRYAGRRNIEGVGASVPVYQIDDTGDTRRTAILHPITPAGFFVASSSETIRSAVHPDLPYFLHELRPAGSSVASCHKGTRILTFPMTSRAGRRITVSNTSPVTAGTLRAI